MSAVGGYRVAKKSAQLRAEFGSFQGGDPEWRPPRDGFFSRLAKRLRSLLTLR